MLTAVDRAALVADYAARVKRRKAKRNRYKENIINGYQRDACERIRNFYRPNEYDKRPKRIMPG